MNHVQSYDMVNIVNEYSLVGIDNGSLMVCYYHLFCWIETFLIGYITPSTVVGSTTLVVI